MAVGIQIFRSDVVTIRTTPRLRVADGVVTIAIPSVKIISRASIGDFVLRVVASATHHDGLPGPDMGRALRGRDVGLASAHQNFGLIVGVNRNPIAAIAAPGMNRQIGSVDFNVRFAVLYDGIVCQSTGELDLNLRFGEVRDVGLRALVDSQNVGIVELNLRAAVITGRDAVSGNDGRI